MTKVEKLLTARPQEALCAFWRKSTLAERRGTHFAVDKWTQAKGRKKKVKKNVRRTTKVASGDQKGLYVEQKVNEIS